ncbi:MAG: WD40 repeat domain-containing protein [Chloroflexi bacterium]|nr:MAG: WD40 repeat domain-containing protein [Chloroflexota bacterium]
MNAPAIPRNKTHYVASYVLLMLMFIISACSGGEGEATPEITPDMVEATPTHVPYMVVDSIDTDSTLFRVAWSPDGEKIAVATSNGVFIYTMADLLAPPIHLDEHDGDVPAVAWSPTLEQLITGGRDTLVRSWNTRSGGFLLRFEGHTDDVLDLTWSPDSERIASASWDGTVRVWDFASSELLATLEEPEDVVSSVAWSPDGLWLAAGSYDDKIYIWDATGWQQSQNIDGVIVRDTTTWNLKQVLPGHEGNVNAIAWASDSVTLASAGEDDIVRTWNTSTGEMLQAYHGHEADVNDVAWSPGNSMLVSGGADNTVRVWRAEDGEIIREMNGQADNVVSVDWSVTGLLAVGSQDGHVHFWTMPGG